MNVVPQRNAVARYARRARFARAIVLVTLVFLTASVLAALPGVTELAATPEQITDAQLATLLGQRIKSADVIAIGELRDLETISLALSAAETGHLVLGTLTTGNAIRTVERIIGAYPPNQQSQIRTMLSTSLKGIVAQTLCKRKTKGRIAALEILNVTSAIANLIREGKTFQIPSQMQVGGKEGMVLLNDALFRLVKEDIVLPEEALMKSVSKKDLAQKLQGAGFDVSCSMPGM